VTAVEFRILGPLQVFDGGSEIDVGSGRQRILLALLLLSPNEVVPTDRLVEELWDGRPPPSAAKSMQNGVVRLRKLLGDRIVTRGGGYALRVEPGELDSERFAHLVELARQQDERQRAQTLRQALGLWRGAVLADALPAGLQRPEVRRLEEMRVGALESRIDADLESGGGAELVGELEGLVAEDPYRERPRAQLMLALYREGRQAEALAVYRDGRRVLAEELGLEPSPALRELERAILAHDPALERPAPPTEPTVEAPRRRRLLVAIVAAAVGAGAAAAILEWPGGRSSVRIPPNSIAMIDVRTNRVTGSIAVGSRPAYLAVGFGSLWVANLDDGTVSRIDLRQRTLARTIPVGGGTTGLATGDGSVWIASAAGVVQRIDPAFDATVQRIISPSYARYGFEVDQSLQRSSPIATGGGTVWFGHSSSVARIDPQAGQEVGAVGVGVSPSAIAVADGSVWVADSVDNTVMEIQPSGATTTIPVGDGPSALVVGAGGVWVSDLLSDSVVEIDPTTDAVLRTIPVGDAPTGIALGDGSVWVTNSRSRNVMRIDPMSGRVIATIPLGESPSGIAFAAGRIWVSVQRESAPSATANGTGVLRVNAPSDLDSIDPAQAGDTDALQVEYATCAKLLDYPDAAAPSGSQLRPEVAAAMPSLSDGGRIYTFRIRPGIRFSPPSGQPVTAKTFRYSIERAMRVNPDAARMLADVSAISAQGDTLTVRLRAAAPDLPARLAFPYFCAVPTNTPEVVQRVQPIPSAGPYYIASYTPGQSLLLRRNPNYHGSRPRRLREIAYTFGVDPGRTVHEIEGGTVDYAAPGAFTNALPPADVPGLIARYGPGSPAAKQGDQRYFENPALGEVWLALNPNRPPFSDESVRRAVAFAVSRPALSVDTGYAFRPDDHLMPPVLPGYIDVHYYPLHGPDIREARKLMRGRHVVAVDYTCTGCSQQVLTDELARVGIDVVTHAFSVPEMLRLVKTPGEPVDIFNGGTGATFADPSEFFNAALVGRNIESLPPHDPATLHALAAAALLTGVARARAYGRLDVELARRAVLVPLGYNTEQDFFSARIGCRVYQPIYGMDLGALCLREARHG
jgi:YVTN family beta-propeller protein